MKTDIHYVKHESTFTEGVMTIHLFYPNGEWDADKLIYKDALQKYPKRLWNWIEVTGY